MEHNTARQENPTRLSSLSSLSFLGLSFALVLERSPRERNGQRSLGGMMLLTAWQPDFFSHYMTPSLSLPTSIKAVGVMRENSEASPR